MKWVHGLNYMHIALNLLHSEFHVSTNLCFGCDVNTCWFCQV